MNRIWGKTFADLLKRNDKFFYFNYFFTCYSIRSEHYSVADNEYILNKNFDFISMVVLI